MLDSELALLSEAVYLPEWGDVEKAIASTGWKLVAPMDISNTEAMVCRKGKVYSIIPRGTEASRGNLWDIFQNIGTMAEWEGPGSVHSGYNNYVNKIFGPASWIMRDAEKVVAAGHSMGGAAATLYALKAKWLGMPITELVTFGSPKCMNKAAAATLESLPIRRYANKFDLAIRWPLNPWFVHPCPYIDLSRGHSVTGYKIAAYKESFK